MSNIDSRAWCGDGTQQAIAGVHRGRRDGVRILSGAFDQMVPTLPTLTNSSTGVIHGRLPWYDPRDINTDSRSWAEDITRASVDETIPSRDVD